MHVIRGGGGFDPSPLKVVLLRSAWVRASIAGVEGRGRRGVSADPPCSGSISHPSFRWKAKVGAYFSFFFDCLCLAYYNSVFQAEIKVFSLIPHSLSLLGTLEPVILTMSIPLLFFHWTQVKPLGLLWWLIIWFPDAGFPVSMHLSCLCHNNGSKA